jgi:vancomycin resistance protein VanJ
MAHHPRAKRKFNLWVAAGWFYAGAIFIWYVLYLIFGDSNWIFALMNTFVPYYFLPLPVMIPLAFFIRRVAFWQSMIPPLVVFIALFGHLFLPEIKNPNCPGQPPLTVATFNRYGYSDILTLEAFKRTGLPDILALQETLPHQFNETIVSLGDELPYHLLSQDSTGLAIFSRYPISRLPSQDLQDSRWFVMKSAVETPAGRVVVYNVHMTTTRVLSYLSDPGFIPEIITYTSQARREMAQRLVEDIAAEERPVVLLGDFNSTPLNAPAYIIGQVLTDAYVSAGWGFGHTFPSIELSVGPLRSLSQMVRIDMIFVSSEFEPVLARVGEFFGQSDHLPVVSQLAWHVCEP